MDREQVWYTVRETARELRVSVATVRRLIWAGKLKAARFGRAVRIDRRELEKRLAKGGVA